ncbi:hypothetical protein BaRGS_00017948 [Batillaria attramentaria]|uniref:Uncharacterized protein n=1 Tax=Batillaria attramentaria TaxID=370345 RepID=A0ABD0KUM0_9CAEN
MYEFHQLFLMPTCPKLKKYAISRLALLSAHLLHQLFGELYCQLLALRHFCAREFPISTNQRATRSSSLGKPAMFSCGKSVYKYRANTMENHSQLQTAQRIDRKYDQQARSKRLSECFSLRQVCSLRSTAIEQTTLRDYGITLVTDQVFKVFPDEAIPACTFRFTHPPSTE